MQATRAEAVGAAPMGERSSMLMRAVNMNLRSLSADLDRTEPVAFFCECRLPRCFAALWMTNPEFDAAVEAGKRWLVVAGHHPSGPFTEQAPRVPAARTSSLGERPARHVRTRARAA
ncbi:MAG TPA: hypothetical protein VFU56_08085 [Gaiellaceae bacterium]|nr:hypothetical protein [Gaiellaceae bacterium]